MSEIMVSVVCNTYNHSKYIRKCLEGFVRQRVNFKYQVFVHDDASTDGTAEIIREYEQKYPSIIKPIYQKENQYSKGVKITSTYIYPVLEGKYVALCEGDDCWIDDEKLQIQFDYMEKHPECAICTHNAIEHDVASGTEWLCTNCKEEINFSTDKVIKAGGSLFATNSVFVRRECYTSVPSVFDCPGVGDYPLFVYTSTCGECHYLPLVMSKYNAGVEGSWSERIWCNPEKRVTHLRNIIEMLKRVDQYYNYKYTASIQETIADQEFMILETLGDENGMRNKKYRKNYYERRRKLSIEQRKYRKFEREKQLRKVILTVREKLPLVVKVKHMINRFFNLPGQK